MRNQMIACPKCNRQSRLAKIWHCPHCDYLKPNEWGHRVTKLRAEPWPEPPPRKLAPRVAAKAERRLEREQLAQDIAKIDRSKLPGLSKLRPKIGLRRS